MTGSSKFLPGRVRGAVVVAALWMGLLGGACSRQDRPEVTLRFWNGFTGPDGRPMQQLVKEFNRENPDIRIIMQRMDWYTYYNKLFVAGIGGRAPEVFIIHASNIPRFIHADFLRPMDDLLEKEMGLDQKDFFPQAWNAAGDGGKQYGIPLDISTHGMYYNKSLFRAAGIVDATGEPRPPCNQKEFMEALRKLTLDRDGDGDMDQWGFVFTNTRNNLLVLMVQFGGMFFDRDNRQCLLNSEGNVRALTWCRDLIHREKLVPSPENFIAWLGFRQGNVAMAFEGIYMLADLQKQTDLDFGVAPIPTIGEQPATLASSHIVCLRRDLKNPELQAASRFARFLTDRSLDWAAAGQVPARLSLLQTDRFRSMEAQATFAQQLDHVFYEPNQPFNNQFDTEFNEAVEKALRNSETPQAALDRAVANTQRAVRRHYDLWDQAKNASSEKSSGL
ncbi:MAG: ABC transporter substrate-binding protein [Sphaerospermopsis kisseleviana]